MGVKVHATVNIDSAANLHLSIPFEKSKQYSAANNKQRVKRQFTNQRLTDEIFTVSSVFCWHVYMPSNMLMSNDWLPKWQCITMSFLVLWIVRPTNSNFQRLVQTRMNNHFGSFGIVRISLRFWCHVYRNLVISVIMMSHAWRQIQQSYIMLLCREEKGEEEAPGIIVSHCHRRPSRRCTVCRTTRSRWEIHSLLSAVNAELYSLDEFAIL